MYIIVQTIARYYGARFPDTNCAYENAPIKVHFELVCTDKRFRCVFVSQFWKKKRLIKSVIKPEHSAGH
jgi:hypothetical protein